MVSQKDALPGRMTEMAISPLHFVLKSPMAVPTEEGAAEALFALGCFWGAERLFWLLPGVISTAVGYAGGYTENPTYEEVCSGRTGHTETVRVLYRSSEISYRRLLQVFFEGHDPTQYFRQGNDFGSQYRSAVFTFDEAQYDAAHAVKASFDARLREAGFGPIVTEVVPVSELATSRPFFFAEDYHQQYLAKNPAGYCGLGGTGVSCPVGLPVGGSPSENG